MMRKKSYIEKDKITAEKRLEARLEMLKSKGMDDLYMRHDATVRHYKGEIRQAKDRLASIADLEKLMAEKAEIKASKLAAPKVDSPKKKQAADPDKKKAKQERKQTTAVADEE